LMELEGVLRELEDRLLNVLEGPMDAILFSGGIDTSLLAVLAYRRRRVPLVTCVYKDADPPDLCYAVMLAKRLGAEHHIKYFGIEEAVEAAREVIRILRVFDPMEVRNSVVIYIGLRFCRDLGFEVVATGDGGDELFAGYSFLYDKPEDEVEMWIRNIVGRWSFSSVPIGRQLGVRVVQPYTHPEVVDLALRIPVKLKIARVDGRIYGKYVMRLLLERYAPRELAWRSKDPIEVGSGATRLSGVFAEMVTEEEFRSLSREVKLRDREQAYYYKVFRSLGYRVEPARDPSRACAYCGAEVAHGGFCRVCGAYPALGR